MDQEYDYLLHLLGAFVRRDVPQVRDGVDWQKLTELAQIHSVTGILGYMSMGHPICPDGPVKAQLRQFCLNTIVQFARRHSLAQSMVRELELAQIDHIVMKGYVLRDLYPVPELRTFSDIDILIRPEDRKRCHELLLSLGYQVHTDWEPVFSYFKGQELYEVHTELVEDDVFRDYFQNPWQHTRPLAQHRYSFTPEFHFLYLLAHIAKHVHGAGAGARMYLDVAAFILRHGEGMDWPWIAAQLEALKLSKFAGVVLSAVEAWFRVPCPMAHERTDQSVLRAFRDFTLEAGVFGHHNRDKAMAGLKQTAEDTPRWRQLLGRAFPPAGTIQTRYTYLQKKPWLLPAAWVHRLFKTRRQLPEHAREARQIMGADPEAVQRLRRLMEDIGL